jgi:hypothetical protein
MPLHLLETALHSLELPLHPLEMALHSLETALHLLEMPLQPLRGLPPTEELDSAGDRFGLGGGDRFEFGAELFAEIGQELDDFRAPLQDRFREFLQVSWIALPQLTQRHDDGEGVVDAVLHFPVLEMKLLEFSPGENGFVRVHEKALSVLTIARRVPLCLA